MFSLHKINILNYIQDFKLDESVKTNINEALATYKTATSRLHFKNFELFTYGKSFVKKFQLSPDSLMQSAIQIAYYKTFGTFVSTYESASTSAFKLGRTETMRPSTMETKKLAELFAKSSNDVNASEALKQMQVCSKLHNQLVKEASTGQGFDRHLFAMKYHAVNRLKRVEPEFYQSEAYKKLNYNIISTSTLAYEQILTGGFAPVVPDGFGIGYRILDASLGACISSNRKSELERFAATLEETYARLYELLKRVDKKKDD